MKKYAKSDRNKGKKAPKKQEIMKKYAESDRNKGKKAPKNQEMTKKYAKKKNRVQCPI